MIFELIRSKRKSGSLWVWEDSAFRKEETNGINWWTVFFVVLSAAQSIVSRFLAILSFKYAILAGINQGLMTSLYSLSAIFLAIAARFLFNERMKPQLVVGMILLFLGVVLIGFSSNEAGSELTVLGETTTKVSSITAVAIGVLCPISFACAALITKYAKKTVNLSPTDLSLSSSVLINTVFVLLWIFLLPSSEIPLETYIRVFLGSFCAQGGYTFIQIAVTIGPAGPAAALSSTEAIFATIFNTLAYAEIPSIIQLFGLGVGVIGAIAISAWPDKEKKVESESSGKDDSKETA